MTNPEKEPMYESGAGMRRSYEEKAHLLLDLAMLLFGGLVRILKARKPL